MLEPAEYQGMEPIEGADGMANEEGKLTGDGIGPGEIDWDAAPTFEVPGLDDEEPLPTPAGYPHRFDFSKMGQPGPIDDVLRRVDEAAKEYERIHGTPTDDVPGPVFRAWLREYDLDLAEDYSALGSSIYLMVMGAADVTKSIEELYKDELEQSDMTVSEMMEWEKNKIATDKRALDLVEKQMGSYMDAIQKLLKERGLVTEGKQGINPVIRPTSPSPFGPDGNAYFASNPIAAGMWRALLSTGAWSKDEDGKPYYVHKFGKSNGNQKGQVLFQILDPESIGITPEAAAGYIVDEILKEYGPATARLHHMLLAYAANNTGGFTLSKQQVYQAIGVAKSQLKRNDISAAQKNKAALAEIERLQRFGYMIQSLELRPGKGRKTATGKKGDSIFFRESSPSPFWNITIEKFGQATFIDDEGTIRKDYEDWEINVTPGKSWAERFLYNEEFRQVGIFSRAEFDNWASKSLVSYALWARLQIQVRVNRGQPVTLTNREILSEIGINLKDLTKDQRKPLRNQVYNAISELEKAGWGIDEHTAIRGAVKWEDFLAAQTTFTAPAAVRDRYASILLKGGTTPALEDKRKSKPAPKVEQWTATDIDQLAKHPSIGSGAKLAKMLGVTPAAVSYLRSGGRAASTDMCERLEKIKRELDKQAKG